MPLRYRRSLVRPSLHSNLRFGRSLPAPLCCTNPEDEASLRSAPRPAPEGQLYRNVGITTISSGPGCVNSLRLWSGDATRHAKTRPLYQRKLHFFFSWCAISGLGASVSTRCASVWSAFVIGADLWVSTNGSPRLTEDTTRRGSSGISERKWVRRRGSMFFGWMP